jgi:Photosynthetic reaction centre cytochrome C subunit
MLLNKRITVMLSLVAIVIIGVAASAPPQDKPPKRNLKVLPKDISHDELEKVMDGFKDALGVRCNYCHAQSKTEQRKMDFASDEKPEKATARKMIKMAARINKKFFQYKPGQAGVLPPITCKTCHNGKPHPEGTEKPHTEGTEKH